MASAMPSEPATQAALAAEGRTFNASRPASKDSIRVSLVIEFRCRLQVRCYRGQRRFTRIYGDRKTMDCRVLSESCAAPKISDTSLGCHLGQRERTAHREFKYIGPSLRSG